MRTPRLCEAKEDLCGSLACRTMLATGSGPAHKWSGTVPVARFTWTRAVSIAAVLVGAAAARATAKAPSTEPVDRS